MPDESTARRNPYSDIAPALGDYTDMDEMRHFRRREGAVSWGIFRDLADPTATWKRSLPSRGVSTCASTPASP